MAAEPISGHTGAAHAPHSPTSDAPLGPSHGPNTQVDSNDTLEADVHQSYNDNDSTFDETSDSYTTSLASTIFNYKYENGRRYHAYREGEYVLPNDEQEQERLDLLHHVFKLAIGGELVRTPLNAPGRVLDIGCGTGNWTMDFADLYPASEVLGVDLSPIMPPWMPPNCRFMVDDIESDWPFREDEKFDYIHARSLCGAIRDWGRLFGQCYTHLKPGGWVEFQEYEAWVKSDDGGMERAVSVAQWQQYIDDASVKFGKRMNVAEKLKDKMVNAGFENCCDDAFKIPIGPWPKHPELKELGRWMLVQMLEAVEPVAIALFTRVLGHSYEKSQALMVGVRSEFKNPRNHLYSVYRYIYGQKPQAPR